MVEGGGRGSTCWCSVMHLTCTACAWNVSLCVPDLTATAAAYVCGGGSPRSIHDVCNVVDGYHVVMHFVLSASGPLQCDCVTYSSTSVLLFMCD